MPLTAGHPQPDLVLEDCTFIGNGLAGQNNSSAVLSRSQGSATVRRCRFDGNYMSLLYHSGTGVVEECEITRPINCGIRAAFTADISIANNTIEGRLAEQAFSHGIVVSNGAQATLTGNTIQNHRDWAVRAINPGTRVTVRDNTITSNGRLPNVVGGAIELTDWVDYALIEGNTMQDNRYGVQGYQAKEAVVRGNRIFDTTGYEMGWGIVFWPGAKATIEDNEIEGGRRGIEVRRDCQADVMGNTVARSSIAGVVVSGCDPLIADNLIVDNVGPGIQVVADYGVDASPDRASDDRLASPTILDNVITGNAGGGVVSYDSAPSNLTTLAQDNTFDGTNGAFQVRHVQYGAVRARAGETWLADAEVEVYDATGEQTFSGLTSSLGVVPRNAGYHDVRTWLQFVVQQVDNDGSLRQTTPYLLTAVSADGRLSGSALADWSERYTTAVVDLHAPPTVSLGQPSTTELWPANGKVHNVTLGGNITAGTAPLVAAMLEVDDEYDQYDTSLDVSGLLDANGDFTAMVPLVAARLGGDHDGRTYTLTLRVTDAAGQEASSSSVVVLVPHDQGKGKRK